MMKINREQFKKIVKECLVELLQEGLGTPGFAGEQSNKVRNRDLEPLPGQMRESVNRNSTDPAVVRRRTMDLTSTPRESIYEAQAQRRTAPIPAAVHNSFANDPVMASIMADTAQTTFAAQESPGASVVGDMATKAAASINPVDMFSEEKIDIWNKAAFSPISPSLMSSPMAISMLKK